jgi:hypothetical protein
MITRTQTGLERKLKKISKPQIKESLDLNELK